jgi:5-methylcytosine-specific restriction endonuclease McrA
MVHGRRDPRLTRKYKAQRLIVLARDGYVCTYCGQDANTVDHIVAIKNGGDPISLDNMISCCSRCNSKKGSRSQAVFLAQASTPPAFFSYTSPITTGTVPIGPCEGQTKQDG